MNDQSQPLPLPPSGHHIRHIVRRTLSKSWDDSIFSESAQAAFWCALSLPPLLLGMLGSLAYIAPLFGPDTLPTIQEQLISTAGRFFSPNVVNEIIAPTVRDIVKGARGEVVSIGFVISLWAGLVGHLGVRRLDRRGPRPDAAAPPGAAAVLRARPLRGHAGGRDRRRHHSSRWDRARSPSTSRTAGTTCWRSATTRCCSSPCSSAVNILYRVSLPKPLPSHRLLLGLDAGDGGVPGRHVWACGST